MSNIFQEVLTDVNGLENKLLGPSYPYWQNIKSPSQIGMSSEGSLSAMGRDIDGLIQYVEVLVTGGGNASTTGGPLGNKFFLQSGGKCLDVKNCKDPNDTSTCPSVDRFIYINNVPQGNIPFISSAMGENFSEFKGLIPGTISNLNAINPFAMMQSFMAGSTPPCQEVTLETINVNNVKSTETHFVTVVDLQNMDPCNFKMGKIPLRVNHVDKPLLIQLTMTKTRATTTTTITRKINIQKLSKPCQPCQMMGSCNFILLDWVC